MRESVVEKYLVKRVKEAGGMCLKFTSPSTRSVPDRLVIVYGRMIFVEVKAPGEKLRKDQRHMAKVLKSFYHTVHVLDSKEAVDHFIIHTVGGR